MRNHLRSVNLDVNVVIPAIQELINQERTVLEANKVLKNLDQYLEDDYRISQLQKLICFLTQVT